MEEPWKFLLSASIFFVLTNFLSKLLSLKKRRNKNFPPSPPGLPILGHLHLIKEPVHRSFQRLSHKYGPIIFLSFGSNPVIIVSSPSLVEECFTKNDVVLANRPHFLAGKYIHYNYTTLGAANYGHHWRNLRRLASLEIFATGRLNTFVGVRHDEVRCLIKNLMRSSGGRQDFVKVEMTSRLSELSFNIIMRMVTGKRYFGIGVDDEEEAKRFRGIIRKTFELSGASNLADFLPALRWVDHQSFQKRLGAVRRDMDEFLQNLFDDRRNKRRTCEEKNRGDKTMLDAILRLQEAEPEYYTDEVIFGLIVILLVAGTDTSSVTIEWGMSLLLNHPDVMRKARAEVDKHVGKHRLADETDLPKLPYLHCIINETHRLFPAAPLLVPHAPSDDCIIGGFDIPKGATVFVNAWAIHRDGKVWEDPESFKPERFEGMEIDAYKLLPFGVGRRSCPGVGLANRVVGLTLAVLIQCFEWERVEDKEIDMAEGTGLTMPKTVPLEAMCKARHCMTNLLSEL